MSDVAYVETFYLSIIVVLLLNEFSDSSLAVELLCVQVNGCSGQMGKAVIQAADSIGLQVLPESFGSQEESGLVIEVCGKEILLHGPFDRERVLASIFDKYPNMIVVDYTVPSAVNGKQLWFSFFEKRVIWMLELGGVEEMLDLVVHFLKMGYVLSSI